MTQDDRMETIAAETDNPTVCITHGRFIPCRNEDWHHFTDNPYWVKSVRDFQGSDDPNLTWEPATLTITDPAEIRACDEPDERGEAPTRVTEAGAVEYVSRAELQVQAVRTLHRRVDVGWAPEFPQCSHCCDAYGDPDEWPCVTLRVMDGVTL